jgi:hypothetical protein
MNQTLADALGKLAGNALSSVEFVADYVQLRFDGPSLTAYTSPTVTCGSQTLSLGQPNYRDVLCGQIGRRVERAAIDSQRVSIIFENGPVVSVSLRNDTYQGPEALRFSLDENLIWVV